jgi:hypothetical protein
MYPYPFTPNDFHVRDYQLTQEKKNYKHQKLSYNGNEVIFFFGRVKDYSKTIKGG